VGRRGQAGYACVDIPLSPALPFDHPLTPLTRTEPPSCCIQQQPSCRPRCHKKRHISRYVTCDALKFPKHVKSHSPRAITPSVEATRNTSAAFMLFCHAQRRLNCDECHRRVAATGGRFQMEDRSAQPSHPPLPDARLRPQLRRERGRSTRQSKGSGVRGAERELIVQRG
jgi:hypothetical protein